MELSTYPFQWKASHKWHLTFNSLKRETSLSSKKHQCLAISSRYKGKHTSFCLPLNSNRTGLKWKTGGTAFGSFLGFSTFGVVHAESPVENYKNDSHTSHGKKVYTDFSVTGIPGDGRCLFRSIAHGACLRSGKVSPSETLQRELADELRALVADEFIKRRSETEWFVEGDFDTYVSHIRMPHVWGGEPELLMASHVLQMPITVYLHDEESGGLISIAEYGQEYGKDNPIRVLYNGSGHYDALQITGEKSGRSRL